jgi:hypothetical protein
LLKSFVQDLVGSRFKVFPMAIIAGANQDRDPAVDVSFIAPLPKCHFFHALCQAPRFADFTNDGFVFDCIPIPWLSPLTQAKPARYFLRGV